VLSVDPVNDLDPVRLSADKVPLDVVEISSVRVDRVAGDGGRVNGGGEQEAAARVAIEATRV